MGTRLSEEIHVGILLAMGFTYLYITRVLVLSFNLSLDWHLPCLIIRLSGEIGVTESIEEEQIVEEKVEEVVEKEISGNLESVPA